MCTLNSWWLPSVTLFVPFHSSLLSPSPSVCSSKWGNSFEYSRIHNMPGQRKTQLVVRKHLEATRTFLLLWKHANRLITCRLLLIKQVNLFRTDNYEQMENDELTSDAIRVSACNFSISLWIIGTRQNMLKNNSAIHQLPEVEMNR